jgi:hypothetical protein
VAEQGLVSIVVLEDELADGEPGYVVGFTWRVGNNSMAAQRRSPAA